MEVTSGKIWGAGSGFGLCPGGTREPISRTPIVGAGFTAGWAAIRAQLQALWGGASTKESDGSRLAFCGRAWLRVGTVEAVRALLGVQPSQTQPELPDRASCVICGAKCKVTRQSPLLKMMKGFKCRALSSTEASVTAQVTCS